MDGSERRCRSTRCTSARGRACPRRAIGSLTYRELAAQLVPYVKEMGFTHVELMPVMEHPFYGSWGYQVTGYFAPTSRYGTPQDFKCFVDALPPGRHRRDPRLGARRTSRRTRTASRASTARALYEHADPRQGEHPDWGTLIFNYGRNEVRNFLLAQRAVLARRVPHRRPARRRRRVDALPRLLAQGRRVDPQPVRRPREPRGDRRSCAQLNALDARASTPASMTIAEESTAWPGVSRPVVPRRPRLHLQVEHGLDARHARLRRARIPSTAAGTTTQLTFSLLYAFTENFVLPLSHDEVVHGKGSLLDKMPGDDWQKLANLRALYGYMYAHPGQEAAVHGRRVRPVARVEPRREPRLAPARARRCTRACSAGSRDLNRAATGASRRCTRSTSSRAGFEWIDCNDSENSVVSFIRRAARSGDDLRGRDRELHAGAARGLLHRRPRPGGATRDPQQRRGDVRRQQRRQRGRHPVRAQSGPRPAAPAIACPPSAGVLDPEKIPVLTDSRACTFLPLNLSLLPVPADRRVYHDNGRQRSIGRGGEPHLHEIPLCSAGGWMMPPR